MQKRERYRADPVYAETLRERSREYASRNVESRRAYLRDWNARRKADPELAEKDRVAQREKQRRRRAALRTDPVKHAAALQARRNQRAGAVREIVVEKYLCERVQAAKGFCPKFVDPSRRGAPDRLVLLPGHPTVFVELKRPKGGVLSVHQSRYHEAIRAAGQTVFVAWSKGDVDSIMETLV